VDDRFITNFFFGSLDCVCAYLKKILGCSITILINIQIKGGCSFLNLQNT